MRPAYNCAQERGAENVFDYSIGNPDVEPPDAVIAALRRIVAENRPRSHGYMPNAGYPEVRATLARRLAERSGLPFTGDDILMTSGAAGAINIILKAILDPGDEVMVLAPYFPEYRFYIENHGGRVVTVETDEQFPARPGAHRRGHHAAHPRADSEFTQQSDRRDLQRCRAARSQPGAPGSRAGDLRRTVPAAHLRWSGALPKPCAFSTAP